MTEFEHQPVQEGFSGSEDHHPQPASDFFPSTVDASVPVASEPTNLFEVQEAAEEITENQETVAEGEMVVVESGLKEKEPVLTEESVQDLPEEPETAEIPQAIRTHFRPLWTIGQTHAPFADVSLQDDAGVSVTTPQDNPPRWRFWARESLGIARDVALALAIAVLIGVFVIQPVKVEGTSMLPRLHDGERIFINRFIYNFRKIERGDIVVFYYPKDPGKNFIKRVIGLPGDEITISNGKLRINGQLVPENYLSKDYTTNISAPHTWVVEPHHYFVMGDNRDASNDSRSWGYVPEMYIYGKAVFRYWPLSEAGGIGDEPADLKPLRDLGRQSQTDPDEE